MRKKLVRSGGNKFIPAKGMKNVKKTPKSKSPPPGVGVLEEDSDLMTYENAKNKLSMYLNAKWLWSDGPNEMYDQWEKLYNVHFPRSGEEPDEYAEITKMYSMISDQDKVEKYLKDKNGALELEKIVLSLFSKQDEV